MNASTMMPIDMNDERSLKQLKNQPHLSMYETPPAAPISFADHHFAY